MRSPSRAVDGQAASGWSNGADEGAIELPLPTRWCVLWPQPMKVSSVKILWAKHFVPKEFAIQISDGVRTQIDLMKSMAPPVDQKDNHRLPIAAPWMRRVLLLAGIYNLIWGTFVICFPLLPFQWARMEPPRYPEIWQCVGMIVGVYGIGYIIAAFDPLRHWPVVLVGFLGKVLGPVGMANALWQGKLPLIAGLTCLTNDLIWWVPFGIILWRAYQAAQSNKNLSDNAH